MNYHSRKIANEPKNDFPGLSVPPFYGSWFVKSVFLPPPPPLHHHFSLRLSSLSDINNLCLAHALLSAAECNVCLAGRKTFRYLCGKATAPSVVSFDRVQRFHNELPINNLGATPRHATPDHACARHSATHWTALHLAAVTHRAELELALFLHAYTCIPRPRRKTETFHNIAL